MDEFDIIARFFAPLALEPGAAGLTDDVAEIGAAGRMIVSTDTIVEGVHFLPSDPLDTVAAKLLRVNVSDIHAKGGAPMECVLNLVWPWGRDPAGLEAFSRGLQLELSEWNVRLLGGDTTGTTGPLVLSMTLTGSCGSRGPVRRSGGKAGDDLWITGVIGDGWMGLQAALGRLGGAGAGEVLDLVDGYRRPRLPGQRAARLVAERASAAMDVSDGLVADAGKLATASGLGVRIEAASVPLGRVGARLVAAGEVERESLLTGGDDYQILFAAPQAARSAILAQAAEAGVRLTCIGVLQEEPGIEVVDSQGRKLDISRTGWVHGTQAGS